MQVTVHLFAGLRDIVGGDITERFDADSISVSALRERLAESHEKLKPYLSGVAIAVTNSGEVKISACESDTGICAAPAK